MVISISICPGLRFPSGLLPVLLFFATPVAAPAGEHLQYSGIYPHLAFFNDEQECGTGAVVPWAGQLWAITYAPHKPRGSSDKLYEIDDRLNVTIRPESVGGTPASRMIHRESEQLFLGPYVIHRSRNVRVLSPEIMPGRLTGNARHLTDPAHRIYYATMEEGFYEVDVRTLAVTELYPDANRDPDHGGALLPGYHGKGLYSAQGRLVYSNNGERSDEALRQPRVPSGCLAEWDGTTWTVVRRNQFTEVTGPDGIQPGDQSAASPLWSIGWDHRSLILQLLDRGTWHSFRLPKASFSYDGAHGWNTEWPRIRDIGEEDLLMTMHGTFWRFPRAFSAASPGGIAPRSTYLKVIGDFCRWQDRVVFGCDDAARSEFLNRRPAKGEVAGPGFSQSNLWFVEPDRLDRLGPPLGRGAVWLMEPVRADTPSDPFLLNGYERRAVHLAHTEKQPVRFTLETDRQGSGRWTPLCTVAVPGGSSLWQDLSGPEGEVQWVRLRTDRDCVSATAWFNLSARDDRTSAADPRFEGIARPGDTDWSGGLIRAGGGERRPLTFAAVRVRDGRTSDVGYYEVGADMKLVRADSTTASDWLRRHAAVPAGVLRADAASVLVEEDGRRFRLPRGSSSSAFDGASSVPLRVAREVTTERDLFNAWGTFYELPARNAGGLAKIRPITTHNRRITDYCSWRGLLVLTGIAADAAASSHILRSDDGQCAVWVGAVDDLWQFGKPSGEGGPWKETPVRAGEPSDPYLMTGFDRKSVSLSHDALSTVSIRVEVDITGDGDWHLYQTFDVPPGRPVTHRFPDAFAAAWLRTTAAAPCRATAWLEYR